MIAQGHQDLISDKEKRKVNTGKIVFAGNDKLKSVTNCRALLLLTEWDEFKTYDYQEIRT